MPKRNEIANPESQADSAPATDIPDFLQDGRPLPKMLVFDLDYTLWPFWIDTHVSPPIKAKDGGTHSVDKYGERLAFYRDVPGILATVRSLPNAPLIATASRTHTPDLAHVLLKQLTIRPRLGDSPSSTRTANTFFDHHQIFPGDKKQHMTRLREKTGVDFRDMLFFDDETRNRNVEQLGVVFWLVRDGVTWGEVERGIGEWRKRRGKVGVGKGEEEEG